MRKKHPPRFIGAKFGEWTIIDGPIRRAPRQENMLPPLEWLCRCSCGSRRWIPDGNLGMGLSKSCLLCSARRVGKSRRAGTLARLRGMVGKKTTRGARILGAIDLGDAYKLTVACAACGKRRRLENKDTLALLSAASLCIACSKRKSFQKYTITLNEAGLLLGVSKQRVQQIVSKGGWPAVKARLKAASRALI